MRPSISKRIVFACGYTFAIVTQIHRWAVRCRAKCRIPPRLPARSPFNILLRDRAHDPRQHCYVAPPARLGVGINRREKKLHRSSATAKPYWRGLASGPMLLPSPRGFVFAQHSANIVRARSPPRQGLPHMRTHDRALLRSENDLLRHVLSHSGIHLFR